MNNEKEKPELISTGSGFSVYYKNKFLYSRHSPQKTVLNLIEQTTVPPETLVLCISPVLGYGIPELIKKLPESAFAAAIEYDTVLMDFSVKNSDISVLKNNNFFYISTGSINLFFKKLEEAADGKNFKKVIRINFSAGAALYEDFYKSLEAFASEYISRFWINKLTLIQFGRNYARNIFKNYSAILKNKRGIAALKLHSITKPILVAGAGPSLDGSVKFMRENKSNLFILAVDAAAARLYSKIKPDAVILLESQYWIQKAFIGMAGSGVPVIADLTAYPQAVQIPGGIRSFFFTEYVGNSFFTCLAEKKILPPRLDPMGSVGLSAIKIAEMLAVPGTPIFHTGLDFSWGCGYTHAKMSCQVRELFFSSSRLKSLYNPAAIFAERIEAAAGKNGEKVYTSPNLKSYAELYKRTFAGNNRFFDIGTCGFLIHSNTIDENAAKKIIRLTSASCDRSDDCVFYEDIPYDYFLRLSVFLQTEKEKLITLKNIFTSKTEVTDAQTETLLRQTAYLYLHFADFSEQNLLNQNFLNRIRIEIEYFLKILQA